MRTALAMAAGAVVLLVVPATAQAPRSADIEVVSFAGPSSVPAGRTGTFVATLRNNGPEATVDEDFVAALVDLTHFGPTALRVTGGTCQLSLAPDCTLGPLAAGQTATLTAVLKATGDVGQKDSFGVTAARNTGQVSEPSPPDATNNKKTVADVRITRSPFRLTGTVARTQRIGSLKATYTCTEACTYAGQAVVKVGRQGAVAKVRGRLAANSRKTVTFRFKRATIRALQGRSGHAVIATSAKNAAGERGSASHAVRLRR